MRGQVVDEDHIGHHLVCLLRCVSFSISILYCRGLLMIDWPWCCTLPYPDHHPSFSTPKDHSKWIILRSYSPALPQTSPSTPTSTSLVSPRPCAILTKADASNSYLPLQFNNLQVTVYDLMTAKVVATGSKSGFTIANKVNQALIVPVVFSYDALNTSDTTWVDMYQACGHIWTNTLRPGA